MTLGALLSLAFGAAAGLAALAALWPAIERLRAGRARALLRLAQGGNADRIETAAPSLRRAPAQAARWRPWARKSPDGGDVRPRSTKLLALMGLGASGAAVLLRLLFDLPLLLGLPLTFAAAMAATWGLGRMRAARRRRHIADSMPEALEAITRALRVGQPVSAALRLTAAKLPGPLGEELRFTAERIAFGQETADALYALARRTGNTDLRFLAASVSIQMVTGGNLAEVLDRLAGIARARQQLARKVEAITAEAKWSGRFLSGFPVLAIAGVWMVDNNYFDSLVESSAFVPVAVVVAALLVANTLFMRWLGRLE